MLDIPEKLLPVITKINDYTYFLLKGGRGGGKSHSIARIVLYLADTRCVRVVCGREVQNTISESVYTVMADIIREYNLNFEIQTNKLIQRDTGSEISFRGFRQQGAFNIQGMEKVDVLWIDESQAITKTTMDHLVPTILRNKNNPKIFFTMNPHVPDDAVVEYCKDRHDVLTVDINYYDNKHLTPKMLEEAEICKSKSLEDYEHIWLGKPLDKSEDAVFSMQELLESKLNKHIPHPNYGMRLAGFDIARFGDDSCSSVIIQQMGALHWEEIYTDEWKHRDLNYTTGRILQIANDYEVNKSSIDEDGLGGGPLDTLQKGRGLDTFVGFRNPVIPYKENKDYANNRTKNVYIIKDMILKGHLAINNEKLMKELCTLRYTYDNQQRKILISKKQQRKDGVASPNLADGLIMAVSLIGDAKAKQERQYRPMQQAAPDGNLFEIAGV